jgi:dual oxidase
MFKIVDKNENGFISFREFLDFFVIFSKGTADDKAKLLFSMYDFDGSGRLTKESFKMMLRSMVELGNEELEEAALDDLVKSLFQRAGLDQKPHITFEDFKQILHDYKKDLNLISLDMQFGTTKVKAAGKRENIQDRARRTLLLDSYEPSESEMNRRYTTFTDVGVIEKAKPKTESELLYQQVISFFENYRRQIFWVSLYTLVLFGIFIERAYYYAVEREPSGLRRICGYGVAITRGAASAMMFTYASMLVTMCRNMITFLRDTFLHIYVPFDEAVAMHKYIGFWSAVFTFVHIIGHCFNIYHISTQTPNDLACLFRNYFHPTDALPKFTKWCWTTITGLTGMALTIQFFLFLIFSVAYARKHTFRGFWIVHMSYPLYFVLMILHGAGRMIQAPYTYYFVLGPIILFTVDQLISVSRRKIEISVVKAKLLPSDVTYLEMKRPLNFQYKSGQWVRVACLARGKNEYHPFTLTSAPHEENLTLHIRAVGPWTYGIRRLYDPRLLKDGKLPKVFIDGPYGESHQDWHRYDVSILVGGGIGVTPFASILKDIAEKSRTGAKFTCKKIYFIWVTRTQRHFEWMTDIIRECEEKDKKNLVTTHVFITQFKDKFDIRTTMLYICEKHFQKISDRSLFTGLRSATHFGRPDFTQFFKMVKATHPDTNVFGVFTCGPPPLIHVVDKACAHDNKYTQNVLFDHHYENI